MLEWQKDKRWSDQYMPTIKGILGCYLLKEAPIIEDEIHNTDLIVLRMEALRIGVRIRRPVYYPRYEDEFTIRCDRPSGNETELSKILSGWGDYLFYGFGAERAPDLLQWHIGDLKIFRLWFNREMCKRKGLPPGDLLNNHDESSRFRVFRWYQLPVGFVIGRKEKSAQIVPAQLSLSL